ncbi:MAG: hypothetical protein KDC87_21690 [Planctomycetes bacterium]|nr:hypothetical protein [Planctomycetota bacterium]MCB9868532.1 hypothetical protein [Planctomycetota bacterium]
MKPHFSLIWLSIAFSCVACSGGANDSRAQVGVATGIDHPYFPLQPGSHRTYEGDAEGVLRRDEVFVLEQQEIVDGVACVAVRQEKYLADVLQEITVEWYATDASGNVWKYGEQGQERTPGGEFERVPDSWRSGEEGMQPALAMPALLDVGTAFVMPRGDGTDEYVVAATGVSAVVPAGVFGGCVEMHENPQDPVDADIVLYAPGVGPVSETSQTGRIWLVQDRRR